ncbi:hypothetical protein JCM31826_21490 [Thermaurantimonas aggregans]|uniref:Uncharacterized protein n=1 Tax=Thermaurantimonas aggregans TaxID=2173829 RepID=A0A401XNS5_9FLAO|nr:hypothetical protein [Thermaurantimonas aggregans]MCX8149493.1 hypothetical protein [Thermaurantimonas aggregans]GCD78667.1 hypothetical protein JCM31826_21490 [Thermaurantimonas aggregans]
MNLKTLSKILFAISIFNFVSCNTSSLNITPENHLNAYEDSVFKYSIIRYAGKLPPKATHRIKFDPSFDEYYIHLAQRHKLDFFYPSKDGFIYFQISRIAPSLHEKYVGIGGKLKKDKDGNIIYYEEVYRTWKMPYDDLIKVSKQVFIDMVNGKKLEKYYTKNTPDNVYIIEFPDDETYFDTEKRVWVSKRENPLIEFENERQKLYEKKFFETKKTDSLN